MSVSIARFSIAVAAGLIGVVSLTGCSGSSSSALVTASPGSVPQLGQVVATTGLSSGGHEASRCGGVDDAARDALQASARERGWTVDHFSADGDGCWTAAEMTAQGQVVELAVDADQESSTASLRVKDVVVTPSPTSTSPKGD